MLSAEAEVESIREVVAKHLPVYGVVVTPLALTFQVRFPTEGIDIPFDALRRELMPKGYVPTVTREKGETLVHVQRRPPTRFTGLQVNLILLGVTILTTVFFGGAWNWAEYAHTPWLSLESIGWGAVFFSVPLLTILGSHEMGHYLVSKRYHVHASLPFFLPSVPPLGTFGAFISMRDPIPSRRALLDIGVSGPLVGFAIAIPVTLAGLALSSGSPAVSSAAGGELIQPSLLFLLLSQFFPLPDTFVMHPLAFAGWVGLFVTAINLLPAGQLDGGHVARALLGRRQFYVSWGAVLTLFSLSLFTRYPGWFIFGFLILMLGVRHPPPLNDLTRLDVTRKLVGIAAVAILILTFVPVPFVAVENQADFAFTAPDGTALPPLNRTIALGQTIVIQFAVENTGPIRTEIVVSASGIIVENMEESGFVIRFTQVAINGTTTTLSGRTAAVNLTASQRAVFDLQVSAPPSWPVPLPKGQAFFVEGKLPDGIPPQSIKVKLWITP
ncbi:MAG: site-2 protease family protein [Methanobacteriota archaeon]|nr:MAG: site-2 protease family protein [Euryarchaeota archaeon]